MRAESIDGEGEVSGWVGGNFPPSESNTSIDPTINTLLLLCVFHLPASDCYSLHFCLAHHHYWEPTFHGMLWDGKTITSGLTESYWGKQATLNHFRRKYMNWTGWWSGKASQSIQGSHMLSLLSSNSEPEHESWEIKGYPISIPHDDTDSNTCPKRFQAVTNVHSSSSLSPRVHVSTSLSELSPGEKLCYCEQALKLAPMSQPAPPWIHCSGYTMLHNVLCRQLVPLPTMSHLPTPLCSELNHCDSHTLTTGGAATSVSPNFFTSALIIPPWQKLTWLFISGARFTLLGSIKIGSFGLKCLKILDQFCFFRKFKFHPV